jgi:DNA-binding transcriptional LysR family regulator
VVQLNDMALFVGVVKAKSFRRAAEILGMPTSTLSRRISALEADVGLRLLHRSTRKIEVTEAGQVYFDRCRRLVEEAYLAHEKLDDFKKEPAGLLRVSLPVDFASTYLSPLIAEFLQMHPAITFDLDLTPRNVDLVSEPYDVAIRMRPQPDSHMIARPLATLRPKLYASPGYLERAGEPVCPTDLANHQCIEFPKTTTWHLHRGDEQVGVAIDGRVRLNSPGMAQRLATFDLGIVLIPEELVATEVNQGKLQRVLPEWSGRPAPVFVMTESRLLPAKTEHFIAFLRSRLH